MSVFSIFTTKQKNTFLITSGKRLLTPHKTTIAEIKSTVGLSYKFWNVLYLKTLTNLAEYIQELPASEAHHHSGRGGLLAHTLETALNSLRIRRGKLLPPNSDAETVTKFKDIWTYAVFTAALCHDLGKPITDMSIDLLDKKKKKFGTWSPFHGSMTSYKTAHEYKIQYRRNRLYASHERASALFAHHIIPVVGLEWIASNPEVFFYWTNILTGHREDCGAIGSIIHEADKRSVASNLAGDQIDNNVAATTSRKPLHQRILTSLRYQIDEGMLPLNRDGAAGWVIDGKLWVVVKRTLDQVRDHMTQEGQTGIPARNDRIMDELQQYNLLIPNGEKAVWKCQIFAPDWAKAHELTMLCLSVDKVWPSADAVPAAFEGSVTPLNQLETSPIQQAESTESVTLNNHNHTKTIESNFSSVSESPAAPTATTETNYRPETRPPSIDFSALASPDPELVSAEEPLKVKSDIANDSYDGSKESRDKQKEPSQPPQLKEKPSTPLPGAQKIINDGKDFLNWLRDGLHQRKFKVNDVNSRIHMTHEGLFLVSPAIFRQFDKEKWSYAQKRFTKLKLHERNSNGTNIHEYMATGVKKRSMIKGFLITDTANVFPGIELPNINHKLSKVVS
jgi:integrating conjugative element relaxase (TIGR03760 family)